MEFVNIISKKVITTPISHPVIIVGCLAIATVLGSLIYFFITKNYNKGVKYMRIFGVGGIAGILITACICSIFFRVSTDRYKYKGTIDKDKITVSQYEEFIKEYNPTIKGEIYYWED